MATIKFPNVSPFFMSSGHVGNVKTQTRYEYMCSIYGSEDQLRAYFSKLGLYGEKELKFFDILSNLDERTFYDMWNYGYPVVCSWDFPPTNPHPYMVIDYLYYPESGTLMPTLFIGPSACRDALNFQKNHKNSRTFKISPVVRIVNINTGEYDVAANQRRSVLTGAYYSAIFKYSDGIFSAYGQLLVCDTLFTWIEPGNPIYQWKDLCLSVVYVPPGVTQIYYLGQGIKYGPQVLTVMDIIDVKTNVDSLHLVYGG